MNNPLIANAFRWIILLFLQVFILDNVRLGGYINPYLYILFVMLLPFEVPGYIVLISSFLLGLGVDMFSGTGGIHAAAITVIAFVRPFLLRVLSARQEYEPGIRPGIADLGFRWFLTYAGLLTGIHHLVLFLLEVFSFMGLWGTMQRTVLSSLITLSLILITQYLFYPLRSSR